MKSKFLRLQLAALAAIACASCDVMADDLPSTAVLRWEATTQNSDGSPITDLLGYYIYAGTSPDNMSAQYFTASSSLPLNVLPGARYFAVAAVNVAGVESALTFVVSVPTL